MWCSGQGPLAAGGGRRDDEPLRLHAAPSGRQGRLSTALTGWHVDAKECVTLGGEMRDSFSLAMIVAGAVMMALNLFFVRSLFAALPFVDRATRAQIRFRQQIYSG